MRLVYAHTPLRYQPSSHCNQAHPACTHPPTTITTITTTTTTTAPCSERLKEYFEDHAAEKALLRHDKPLAAAPAAAHLKHMPAYLKDPSLITEASEVGGRRQRAQMSAAKKRRLHSGMARGPAGDPLKAAGGGGGAAGGAAAVENASVFVRAPKKGTSHLNEEMTEMEKRALEKGKAEAKKRRKLEGPAPVPKFNVKKKRRR